MKQYKPFFIFLSKFLVFYVVFTFVYKMYLDQYDVAKNEVDFFTEVVAKQTETLLSFFTDSKTAIPHESEPAVKLYFKKQVKQN